MALVAKSPGSLILVLPHYVMVLCISGHVCCNTAFIIPVSALILLRLLSLILIAQCYTVWPCWGGRSFLEPSEGPWLDLKMNLTMKHE